MKLGQYIRQKRGSKALEYRRAVPPDIRHLVSEVDGFATRPGRTELVKTLKTHDPRVANRLAAEIDEAVERAFKLARQPGAPLTKVKTEASTSLTKDKLLRLLDKWESEAIKARENELLNGEVLESIFYERVKKISNGPYYIAQIATHPRQTVEYGIKIPFFDEAVINALASQGFVLAPDAPSLPQIKTIFARYWIDVFKAFEKLDQFPNTLWEANTGDDDDTPMLVTRSQVKSPPKTNNLENEPAQTRTKFNHYVLEWREHVAKITRMNPRQIDMYTTNIDAFARFDGGMYLEEVGKKHVQKWSNAMIINPDGPISVKTARARIAGLKSYWNYLSSHDLIDDRDIFKKLALINSTYYTDGEARKAFEPEDVVKLWYAAKEQGNQPLADLIRLAAFTGGRIGAICRIEGSHIVIDKPTKVRCIFFVKDKNKAGKRHVPIHPSLAKQIDRMLKNAPKNDGYLIESNSKNKYGDRSPALGKVFSRLKKAAGYDAELVFHSIRKTVATLFNYANVPEAVAAHILGHTIPTMTYGLYSGRSMMNVQLDAIQSALTYPDAGFMNAN